MKIVQQYKGLKFDIYAIILDDGSCPFIDFMEQLKKENIASHKSIVNVLIRHADNGPILNPEKSRPIEGKNKLFEFKSPQGARLPYFYMPGRITVITHGFKKGAPAEEEFEKADKWRDQIS